MLRYQPRGARGKECSVARMVTAAFTHVNTTDTAVSSGARMGDARQGCNQLGLHTTSPFSRKERNACITHYHNSPTISINCVRWFLPVRKVFHFNCTKVLLGISSHSVKTEYLWLATVHEWIKFQYLRIPYDCLYLHPIHRHLNH